MSCYESETGYYNFPVGEFNRLKKEMQVVWDRFASDTFDKAVKFYDSNKSLSKDKAVEKLFDSTSLSDNEQEFILSYFMDKTQNGKFAKPKKTQLKEVSFSKIMKNGAFFEINGEAGLKLNHSTKTVKWFVDRNNRAVKLARSHPVAKFFFRFLSGVKWTSKTGGSINYSNEYMEDDGPCEPSECDVYGYASNVKKRRSRYS